MFKRSAIILFILFTVINQSIAQENAEDLLKSIQNKFESVSDFSASIVQTVIGKVSLEGQAFYKKENHVRFEFNNMIIVSDGETSWSFNKKQNKVIITDYDNEGNKILSIRQLIYDYPEQCELKSYESEGKQVLELIPRSETYSFKYARLFINSENLITKILLDDPAAGLIEVNLSDIKVNKDLSESLFQFTPPEGSQVIDLR